MVKYRVSVTDDCMGCGACAVSENFEVKEGKAKPIKEVVEEIDAATISVTDARDICPVDAIIVEEVKE